MTKTLINMQTQTRPRPPSLSSLSELQTTQTQIQIRENNVKTFKEASKRKALAEANPINKISYE